MSSTIVTVLVTIRIVTPSILGMSVSTIIISGIVKSMSSFRGIAIQTYTYDIYIYIYIYICIAIDVSFAFIAGLF